MKNFNYNQKHYDDNLEALLNYRKKKIARQELIFTFILVIILTMFVFYAVKKIHYTEFDGYITTEIIDIKANDDLFITKMYTAPGNFVIPGDTLFSYIYMNHFMENLDVNYRPEIINRERDVRRDHESTRNEINLLRTQINEIERQLGIEDHNIAFGISDNARKMELQRRLVELRERLRGKRSEFSLLNDLSKELKRAAEITGYNVEDPATFNDLMSYHNKRKESQSIYRLAHDTAFITDISYYTNAMVFKKEEIMKLQPVNAQENRLHIKGYIPLDNVEDLSYKHPVDIIINDDWSFKARMVIVASRVVELPSNLKSNFSKDTKVLLAVFLPDPQQDIPFWAITDEVPVKIRVNNLNNFFQGKEKKIKEHLIFRTEHGLQNGSKEAIRKKLLHQ